MSSWGYYDDENDDSIIKFCDIVDTEICNNLNPPSKMSYDVLIKKIRLCILEDKSKTEQIFIKHINSIMNDTTNKDRHKTIIGVALTLAKIMANVEIQIQPYQQTPPKSNMDFILEDNFPEKIAEITIDCIQKLIKGWKTVQSSEERSKRLIALNQELYLFSKCKLGIKGRVIQNSFQTS